MDASLWVLRLYDTPSLPAHKPSSLQKRSATTGIYGKELLQNVVGLFSRRPSTNALRTHPLP